jgi:putative ABC transport system ATP-binding protein
MTESTDRPALVRVRDLTKTYAEGAHEHTVLRDLDLDIAEGAFVVLLGRSGSGKSTLLNCLSGMSAPTSGTVEIGGQALTSLSEAERTRFRREHLGFVFQSFNLIPTLTVRENLLLPLELNGRVGSAERERADRLIAEVGLEGRGESFPDRLSGGEQQRVAVARALVHDPLLMLADEPTGNLDFQTAERVLDLVDRLVHQRGKTTLMVTHDRALIRLADRVLTLRGGRLEALSTEDALASTSVVA